MSDRDVEVELARLRGDQRPPSNAIRLSVEDALRFRSEGNIPDEMERCLRLVLSDAEKPFERRRLDFEPDLHSAPTWRREGSRPVTLIPLPSDVGKDPRPDDWRWSDDPAMRALEEEWSLSGRVGGLVIPAEFRGFLFKTIAALRGEGRELSIDSVCSSLARWLSPSEVERIRSALLVASSGLDE
jgi:hypothetical protein